MAFLAEFDTPDCCQKAYDALGSIIAGGALLTQACVAGSRLKLIGAWINKEYRLAVEMEHKVDSYQALRVKIGSNEIHVIISLRWNLARVFGHLRCYRGTRLVKEIDVGSQEKAKKVLSELIQEISRVRKMRRSSAPVPMQTGEKKKKRKSVTFESISIGSFM